MIEGNKAKSPELQQAHARVEEVSRQSLRECIELVDKIIELTGGDYEKTLDVMRAAIAFSHRVGVLAVAKRRVRDEENMDDISNPHPSAQSPVVESTTFALNALENVSPITSLVQQRFMERERRLNSEK